MNDKIKAMFGADVSEVEAKMLVATRATKYYENAVKQLEKSSNAAGSAGGMAGTTEGLNKSLGLVKQLTSAFGMAEAGALLVPGIGVAAVGVAAVSAGIRYISKQYEEAAQFAKSIAESEERVENARISISNIGKSESRIAKEQQDAAQAELDALMESARSVVTNRSTGPEGKVVERDLTMEEKAKAAALEAVIAESKAKQLILAQKEGEVQKEKDKAKKKEVDAEDKATLKRVRDEEKALANAIKKAELEKISNEMALQILSGDTSAETALERLEIDQQILSLNQKITKEKDDAAEKDAKAAEDAAKIRYDYIWKNATEEQKLEQARKEGAAALAAYNKEKNGENLLALNKARAKWLEVKGAIDDANKSAAGDKGDVLATGGRTRNEKGQLTRNGVVISEEDAARSDKARADRQLDSKEISKEDHKRLLEDIRDALKPTRGA